MKIIMKIFIALLTIQTILIYTEAESKVKSMIPPLKKTLFFNGRINKIKLIITDTKNKQVTIVIKPGHQHEYHYKPMSLKKVVCREKDVADTTLSQTDLQNYAAFIFNIEKLEKFHFINVHQQYEVLKLIRHHDPKNENLLNEIDSQTLYYL